MAKEKADLENVAIVQEVCWRLKSRETGLKEWGSPCDFFTALPTITREFYLVY
jgi:hypothetical protein